VRAPFEPIFPGSAHVANTNPYRPEVADPAEAIRERILFEGPETVSCVILEPVQNSGGCFVPPDGYWQRVREICDEFGILLISDEVICSWGRLGEYFGAERFGYVPDLITTAKGLTSSYAPMGAVIASDRVFEPFAQERNAFSHGITFGGHPVAAAVALANLDVFEDESILDNVRANEAAFQAMLDSLRDIPIVGDVRGMGYFWAIELVRDQATKALFSPEEEEWLLRGFLAPEMFRRGLICRADDRGDPVVQLSPPLIAGPEQFEEIRRSCGRCWRRRRSASTSVDDVLTLRELIRDLGRQAARRGGGARPPRPLGAHLRAARPDAMAVGRRAAADHRTAAQRPRQGARVPRAARLASARRAGLRHGLRPRDGAARARPDRRRARLPAVRGALRGAVHRAHREGVHAHRQRALRGAAAGDLGA
jgi:hypothetical protein